MRLLMIILLSAFTCGAVAQVAYEKLGSRINTEFWEDSPSISRDGKWLLFVRSETADWPANIYRKIYVVDLEDRDGPAKHLDFEDSIYNVSLGKDNSIFFTKRLVFENKEEQSFHKAILSNGQWLVEDISSRDSLVASYAHQVADGSIYFFKYKGHSGTGLYRAQWNGQGYDQPVWLGDDISELNTTTFDPFVAMDESWMIFTAYFEADGERGRTGFYFAHRANGRWEKQQIRGLPYAWGANVSPDMKYFIFTDGNDIFRCRLADLNIEFPKGH